MKILFTFLLGLFFFTSKAQVVDYQYKIDSVFTVTLASQKTSKKKPLEGTAVFTIVEKKSILTVNSVQKRQFSVVGALKRMEEYTGGFISSYLVEETATKKSVILILAFDTKKQLIGIGISDSTKMLGLELKKEINLEN